MKADIVLGLGYGDEGKGLTTNYLCSKSKESIVVRFNGGPQAGHTVVVDGKRHVCSNFGAGVLQGAPVYFTEHTTFYPVTAVNELIELKKLDKKLSPKIILHPLTKIITPYDVFADRNKDDFSARTCGLGIGKTMKRNEDVYKLYAVDLINSEVFRNKIDNICGYYNYEYPDNCNVWLEAELKLFSTAINDLKKFVEIHDYSFLKTTEHLVFEGAQGILLDMDHGVFPHVTYSNTTSKNAHDVLDKINCFNRDIFYVTRCYSTRHGSGLFKGKNIKLINNHDETNVYNRWQGFFRIGEIDYDLINHSLNIDQIYSGHNKVLSKNMVVTCLDQRPGFEFNHEKIKTKIDDWYRTTGPTDLKLMELTLKH